MIERARRACQQDCVGLETKARRNFGNDNIAGATS
jgi:hypothetical protein